MQYVQCETRNLLLVLTDQMTGVLSSVVYSVHGIHDLFHPWIHIAVGLGVAYE